MAIAILKILSYNNYIMGKNGIYVSKCEAVKVFTHFPRQKYMTK